MYNPELLDSALIATIQDALVGMKDSEEGQSVLTNVLNTPSIVKTTAQEHLSSYTGTSSRTCRVSNPISEINSEFPTQYPNSLKHSNCL